MRFFLYVGYKSLTTKQLVASYRWRHLYSAPSNFPMATKRSITQTSQAKRWRHLQRHSTTAILVVKQQHGCHGNDIISPGRLTCQDSVSVGTCNISCQQHGCHGNNSISPRRLTSQDWVSVDTCRYTTCSPCLRGRSNHRPSGTRRSIARA